MSYRQKVEIKLNDLQKEFFRLFRKTFPDLSEKIDIETGIGYPNDFCFSVKSSSEIFGKLLFDIDSTEITVYSNFDHIHFPTYHYNYEKNLQRRNQLACISALSYIKEFVSGNVIIECDLQGDKILKSVEYHKDNPTEFFSATVILKEEPKKKSMLMKLKELFRQPKKQPIESKRVNWFGEIK